jgi:hypothetical protein
MKVHSTEILCNLLAQERLRDMPVVDATVELEPSICLFWGTSLATGKTCITNGIDPLLDANLLSL